MNDSLVPDFNDSKDVFPSFASIRNKTLSTLYDNPTIKDKSPKGSVDAPIQRLVDLINQHPSYSTLSSCSGRISLFHPTVNCQDADDAHITTSSSGKGGAGGWLLVSHEMIEAQQLLDCLTDTKIETISVALPLLFQLEPMLLHVAASTLARGQQLLQVALAEGFRESGLVVTSSRLTVAIRSYGLALNVPLALQHNDLVYLQALVEEANRRLERNWTKMERLYEAIRISLFRRAEPVNLVVQRLPELRLWGHAAVWVEHDEKDSILVFGGYGQGPDNESGTCRQPIGRSDRIYCLQRHGGVWDAHWRMLSVETNESIVASTSTFGIAIAPYLVGKREFAVTCMLEVDTASSLIVIFGGRQSPAQALDDLALCEYSSKSLLVGAPTDTRGEKPPARWGASLVVLSRIVDDPVRAVLTGGRNETTVLDSIDILSKYRLTDGSCCLQWESLKLSSSNLMGPRFYHTAVSSGSAVVVFGGLSDCTDLLESFRHPLQGSVYAFDTALGKEIPVSASLMSRFGHAVCCCLIVEQSELLIVSGGVSVPAGDTEVNETLVVMNTHRSSDQIYLETKPFHLEGTIDFGSMVHHSCVVGPKRNELLLLGGGVQGFSFQPCFAKSYHILVRHHDSLPGRKAASNTSSGGKHDVPGPSRVPVVFVRKQFAKQLKVELESLSFLDKRYRISPVDIGSCFDFSVVDDPNLFVAVPITDDCRVLLDCRPSPEQQASWMKLIEGIGNQVAPLSTAMFARGIKK